MGSWDWDLVTGECQWDAGQYRIFGVDPGEIELTLEGVRPLIHPEDLARIEKIVRKGASEGNTFQTEVRIVRPDGQTRWCICAAAMTSDTLGNVTRASGVTIDITELKEAEARRTLLVREVDHRARNALAIVQSIVRMTKSKSIDSYVVDGGRADRGAVDRACACWRSRGGKAPASIAWSTRSSRPTAAAKPNGSPLRVRRCS